MKDKKDFLFDKRAKKYDGFEGKISARFYRLLLSQVKPFSGANVLDVGCGTGTILRKPFDALLRLFHVTGEFYTPDEIIRDFSVFGFEPCGFKIDRYAQIVKLIR